MAETADKTLNVAIAGLGGQGVLKASDILAEAAFRAGYDVKKAEVHGMSQRGGSVCSDVRFGREVFSPMVPAGEADFLVLLAVDQLAANQGRISENGTLICADQIDENLLPNKRSLNIALLGVLSCSLDIDEHFWVEAIRANLPPDLHEANIEAFGLGRSARDSEKGAG